jgi:hypothetical protein
MALVLALAAGQLLLMPHTWRRGARRIFFVGCSVQSREELIEARQGWEAEFQAWMIKAVLLVMGTVCGY